MATTLVSLEEYLSTTYHPDCEWVDGELRERSVGEADHSRLQYRIVLQLGPQESRGGFVGFTEQRVRIRANRYRIPDVCVMRLPWDWEQVITTPPLLIIEILSRTDEPADLLEKLSDYQEFGVPHIWIADPVRRRVFISESGILRPASDLRRRIADPAIEIDFAELFGNLRNA